MLRPRRSVLYMPGSNQRALDKARTLPADGVILDLEDSVAPDAKALARAQIAAAVGAGGYGQREVVIRVNGLDTPWGRDDVLAVAGVGADAVLFPKIESVVQVQQALEALDSAGAPAGLGFWIMVETPRAILDIDAVTGADRRLGCIVMGTSDLAKDMRVRHTPDRVGFVAALSLCVTAARAHGVDIIDGVHLDLQDDVGHRSACEQGRDMGFDGKSLIHPKQITDANEVFAPSAAEVDNAHVIIEAWETAQAEGKGVVVVNGRLVENLHVEDAKRNIALADAIAHLSD